MPLLLLYSAIGLTGALIGSTINNFTTPTTPAAGVADDVNVPRLMLYAAGGIALVWGAKKAGLLKG